METIFVSCLRIALRKKSEPRRSAGLSRPQRVSVTGAGEDLSDGEDKVQRRRLAASQIIWLPRGTVSPAQRRGVASYRELRSAVSVE